MKAGKWERKSLGGVELHGKKLGVVGFGRIGREVAARCRALGMEVSACDPFVSQAVAEAQCVTLMPLDKLLETSDFITLHTTLTKESRHLIGKQALARDQKNGVPRQLVGLEVDWVEVEEQHDKFGLTPAAPAQASRVPVPVYAGGKHIGKATTTTFSPLLKKLIAMASVETAYSTPGTKLQMELTIEARRLKTTATVVKLPFFNPPRKTAVPV